MLQQRPCSSRRRRAAAGSCTALLPLLLLLTPTAAHPYPRDDAHDIGLGFLMPRDCVQYCGYENQYCCGSDQQCYTSNGIAGCKNTAAGGGYNLYTTTWTLTETFTSTFSSLFPAATTATSATCVPEPGSGQIACGNICCASWQYCAFQGQCSANPGAGAGGGGGGGGATNTATAAAPTATFYTTYTTSGVVVTSSYDSPWRATGPGTAATGTATTGTALGATGTGVGTGSTTSSHHLSKGAIAGIVIGTLAGIALLMALCACVLVRGLWHGVLAVLGLRRRRDREEDVTIIEEERYGRHSGGGQHGSWYGNRPPPPLSEKKKSSRTPWLGLGAAVGTILLLLGLRRKHKNESHRPPRSRSDVSSNFYSGSYTASDPTELLEGHEELEPAGAVIPHGFPDPPGHHDNHEPLEPLLGGR